MERIKTSSDHHISRKMLDRQKSIDRRRLLSVKKSTTVNYIHGSSYLHYKVLPRTFTTSNIVFPCQGSFSLTLMKYSPQDHKEVQTEISHSALPLKSDSIKEEYLLDPKKRFQPCYDKDRLRINVSGQCFETHLELFERHPDTLLGNREKRKQFFDQSKNELFFDRHRPSFEAIFCYYQYGGRLKRPMNVPDEIFLSEIMFYQIEQEVIDEYKKAEGYTLEKVQLPTNLLMRKIWMWFEYPETSTLAFIIAIFSVAVTLVSIVLFCVETLPIFSGSHCEKDEAPNFLDPFFIIETLCTAWFTFEVIIRFIVSPNKLEFWKDFKNLVDVMAIVPYYVTLFNVLSTMSCEGAKSSASLAFLRVIRLVRIFKLTKHSVGLQVLVLTFKASLEGLGLFLVALIVCLLVFSSAIYYAELGTPKTSIHSIPDAFWWAIITMTTVGYGDIVPVGNIGKVVGMVCAITGVLTLAIPVPIITGHFNRFYAHKTGRGRHI